MTISRPQRIKRLAWINLLDITCSLGFVPIEQVDIKGGAFS